MTDTKVVLTSASSTEVKSGKYSSKDVRHQIFKREHAGSFFKHDKTYTVKCHICQQSHDVKITNICGRDNICNDCRNLMQLSCGVCCEHFAAVHSLYIHLCDHLTTFAKSLNTKENKTLIENIQKKLDDTEYLRIEGIPDTADIFTEFHKCAITLCYISNKITGDIVTNFKPIVIRGSHFNCEICQQICQSKEISSPFVRPRKFQICAYSDKYICNLCHKNIKQLCGYCCKEYCDMNCGCKYIKLRE